MSSSDVASAVLLRRNRRVSYPVALASRSQRFVDLEDEVRHSGIAVRAAERWNCETCLSRSPGQVRRGEAGRGAYGATGPLPRGARQS